MAVPGVGVWGRRGFRGSLCGGDELPEFFHLACRPLLAAFYQGQFVKEFEEPAWGLAPGQVSDVVQSSFGFHLIRRPSKEEARPRFAAWLQTELAKKAALLASLLVKGGLQ